jgi:hypothetical protein
VASPVSPLHARIPLILGLLLGLIVPASATAADVCLTVDEARDNFSPTERAAALLLLQRQFEREGERVVQAGCTSAYRVSHVRFGTTISITLTGPQGQRDAVARGMDDVPAVYSQMVRSLLRNQPMDAPGIIDRTNVSERQARAANRVYSDSLLYARLGYGAAFGDRTYAGPSIGMLGYRREMDAVGIDVSFFNLQFKSSSRSYSYYGPSGSSGNTGNWLKLELLRFHAPQSNRSFYYGAGMSWSVVNLQNDERFWDGNGLQGELTAGYELGRASSIRVFVQADAGLPFYELRGSAYSNYPPYTEDVTTRYVPSFTVSLGIGWQRGGK